MKLAVLDFHCHHNSVVGFFLKTCNLRFPLNIWNSKCRLKSVLMFHFSFFYLSKGLYLTCLLCANKINNSNLLIEAL